MKAHVVLYRWRVAREDEPAFARAWDAITRGYLLHGSLGSRLHRARDGQLHAYAQWPSARAREAAFSLGAVRPEAADSLRRAAAGREPEIVLDPIEDQLLALPRVRGARPRRVGRALVTGSSGTVGRALALALEGQGIEMIPWDRSLVPIGDYHRMEAFIRDMRPDVLYHLAVPSQPRGPEEGWQVNYHWTSELAWITRSLGVKMIFASTALVFDAVPNGPYDLERPPNAETGYGREKRDAEVQLFRQNPEAVVLRMGWQIGRGFGGNDMVRELRDRKVREGRIRASRRWIPACSFLSDTAEILVQLGASDARGIYQVDANAGDAWDFHTLVERLGAALDEGWEVEADDAHQQDQRLLDPRVVVPGLSDRLPVEGLEPDI